jgi:uncharacterized protein
MASRDEEDDDRRRDSDEDDDDRDDAKKRKKKGSAKDDRQMAMFCHLGNLIGAIIIPLVIWLIKKDESSFIDRHGKEAVNFGITLLIVSIVGGIVTCGILSIVALVFGIIYAIQGAMAANRGEEFKYPICIRFIT